MLLLSAAVAGCKSAGGTQASYRPFVSLVRPELPPRTQARAKDTEKRRDDGELELDKADILPRKDWADGAPVLERLDPMGKITRMTIHHEGMEIEDDGSVAAVKEQLRKIQASHKERMHAGDIGYHFMIDVNGRVWEGRPLKYQGAHSRGEGNKGNIGIMLMGNFEVQRPTHSQLASMRRLVDLLMARYDVPVSRVYTHREIYAMYAYGETDCPGRYLQAEVDRMRKAIASAKKAGVPDNAVARP